MGTYWLKNVALYDMPAKFVLVAHDHSNLCLSYLPPWLASALGFCLAAQPFRLSKDDVTMLLHSRVIHTILTVSYNFLYRDSLESSI